MYFYIIFPSGFNKLEEITNMLQQKFDIFITLHIDIQINDQYFYFK